MAQAMNDLHDADLAACREDDVEQNFAFNFQLASFLSVNRTWFKSDLRRQGLDGGFWRLRFGLGRGYYIGISESTLTDSTARTRNGPVAGSGGNTAAEAGTSDDTTRTMGTASSVTSAR